MITKYGGTILRTLPIVDLIEQETKKLLDAEYKENDIKNSKNSPKNGRNSPARKVKSSPKTRPESRDPPSSVPSSIPFLNPLPVRNDMYVGRLSQNVYLLSKPNNFRKPNYLLAHATGMLIC